MTDFIIQQYFIKRLAYETGGYTNDSGSRFNRPGYDGPCTDNSLLTHHYTG